MASAPTGAVTPAPTRRVVWAIVGFGAGLLASAFIGAAVVAAGGWELDVPATVGSEAGRAARQIGVGAPVDDHRVPAAVLALLNVPLWVGLLGAPLLARREGLRWGRDLGWAVRRSDLPVGLVIGVVTQFAMVPFYAVLFSVFGDADVDAAARALVATVDGPLDVAALVFMTVVMAPVAEEVVYRGLLFGGIRDMEAGHLGSGVAVGVVVSSLVFAGSHFQLVQFPGLFVFGVVAAVLVHRFGRLGPAIWAHVGFNATTVVLLLW